jgi:F-type H+-transporting ATPase subunit a
MNIYQALEGQIPWVLQAALLASALLVMAGFAVRRQIAAANGGIVPDEGVTLRNVLEMIVDGLASLARDTMGDEWRRYFPVVGTIFFFILFSNLMGLVPFLGGSTSDINTTAAWAIISFAVYNYVGIKTHGFWYVNQFLGPSFFEAHIFGKHVHVRLLAPVFFILEVPLHFARIVTLALRLLANMFADHTVVGVWIGLVPIAVPAVFMGLGMLVCVLQAFVFSLLTMIYIGQALEEAH